MRSLRVNGVDVPPTYPITVEVVTDEQGETLGPVQITVSGGDLQVNRSCLALGGPVHVHPFREPALLAEDAETASDRMGLARAAQAGEAAREYFRRTHLASVSFSFGVAMPFMMDVTLTFEREMMAQLDGPSLPELH